MRRVAAFSSLLLTLLAAGRARAADPREQQLAQALFDEARALMEQKRYSEACPKLAESQRLDPGGGTLLNLALCHEKEGKVASAQAEFNDALSLAVRDGRKDREGLARERLAAIEAKIPRMAVVVPASSEVEGLEVKLDGLVLRRAAWGVATAVDPGLHHVEATAPGRQTWGVDVPIEAPERKNVPVPLLAPLGVLGGTTPLPPLPTAMNPPPASGGNLAAPPTFAWEPSRPNPVFYTALGIGVVGFAVSAVAGAIALDANSTAKDGCMPDRHFCKDQASLDAASKARSMAWISTGGFIVGCVGSFSLLFIPPRTRGKPVPQVGIAPLPGGAALGLKRTF